MPPKSKPKSKAKTAPPPPASSGAVVLHWYRTDLRLHDSPSLTAALSLNPTRFIPLWTWDPHYVYKIRAGPNRWKFLLDSMNDLSNSYANLENGDGDNGDPQRLWVLRAGPEKVFPSLFKVLGVTHLVFEGDTDPYAKDRDEKVVELAREAGVEVIIKSGRTLFDVAEALKRNGGKPTMSMGQLKKATEKMVVDRPVETITRIPGCGNLIEDLKKAEQDMLSDGSSNAHPPESADDLQQTLREGQPESSFTQGLLGPNHDCAIPTLSEMGITMGDAVGKHHGGETEALRLLSSILANSEYVGLFEKPLSAPTAFSPQSTTLLSPHHHFGTLSVRTFYWGVSDVFTQRKKEGKKVAAEPMNLIGQVLFRDMYFIAQASLGWSFGQAHGNKIARFIDWHLPSTLSPTTGLLDGARGGYEIDSPEAEIYFQRWKNGTTGFPWIDALMRQLKQEGWIHHLGRHAVACFLTRGGCYVHWERGAEVFEEWLVDHERACNVGNWMWLSCTAFFSQFYRCYSPVAFPKKYDATGEFVRRYVPELARFDKKYIYEPHKAPIADQRKWGCLIKGDGSEKQEEQGEVQMYPKPMFDFNERRQICIDKIKRAYDLKMYGDDKRVLSGEWREIFGFEGTEVGGKKKKMEKKEKGTDEMNGDSAKGRKSKVGGAKRSRAELNGDDGAADVDDDDEAEDEEQNEDEDDKEEDDDDDDDDDEDDQPPPKKKPSRKPVSKGGKKSQKTLDTMVTRNKKGK